MPNTRRVAVTALAALALPFAAAGHANADSDPLLETRPCASDEMGAYVVVNGVGARACVSRITTGPCPPGYSGTVVYIGAQAVRACTSPRL